MSSQSYAVVACLLLFLVSGDRVPQKVSTPEVKPAGKLMLTKKTATQPAVLAAHTAATAKFTPNTAPILVPESDKLFFGKDYPTDERPNVEKYYKGKAGKGFDYPFPNVQPQDEFAKDYVKDENNDNGEWKRQTDYDFARAKLKKEAKEREEARKRFEKEHGDVAGADAASDAADADWEKAQKEAAAADAAKRAEDGKAIDDSGIGGGNGTTAGSNSTSGTDLEKKLAEAEANYAKEQEEFKKCKAELEAAKAELDRLKALAASTALQEKRHAEEWAAAHAAERAAHAKVIAQKRADLDTEKAAVTAVKIEADKKVTEARKKKETANKKAAKEKAEDLVAKKALEKEEADVKKAEESLEKAAGKLRNKGVKQEPAPFFAHSGAAPGSVMTPVLLALALAMARAIC